MISPVTKTKGQFAFKKGKYNYYRDELGNLFCKALDQSNMVGGGYEVERNNDADNQTRLQRVKQLGAGVVLDYGCGNGLLVDYFNKNGVNCFGYDKFHENPIEIVTAMYDVVTMVEVIEHTHAPFEEIDEIYKALKKGGKVMIETSFSDWLTEKDSYIEPKVGHAMIFSHKGLDRLMTDKGFTVGNHINNNVRIYIK